MRALAIGCWAAAWCAVSVATAAAWSAIRRRDGILAVAIASAAVIVAAGLAWIGTVLW